MSTTAINSDSGPARLVHPTGWFDYARRVRGRHANQVDYIDCVLRQDLAFDAIQAATVGAAASVTFHDDASCRAGARFGRLSSIPGQLMGWDAEDECVLDLPLPAGMS